MTTTTMSILNNNGDNSKNYRLKVEKVHAQMVFTSEIGDENGSSISKNRHHRDQKDDFILIDFLEAVNGLGLYCADLTDYVRVGDTISVQNIVTENGIRYAKSASFDFDPSTRGFLETNENSDYYQGRGVVEHVGDWFAGVQANEAETNPAVRNLLMPITALTKDSVPVGKQLSQLRLTALVQPGDILFYKGLRGQKQVASGRKCSSVEGVDSI